jgi:hypothetical protein
VDYSLVQIDILPLQYQKLTLSHAGLHDLQAMGHIDSIEYRINGLCTGNCEMRRRDKGR